jgi:Pyruvate ferredoxin oxidoreductase beta subunit C terminal
MILDLPLMAHSGHDGRGKRRLRKLTEMLQASLTYNQFATHEYLLERYFDANADGHDPSNLQQARALATQVKDRIGHSCFDALRAARA